MVTYTEEQYKDQLNIIVNETFNKDPNWFPDRVNKDWEDNKGKTKKERKEVLNKIFGDLYDKCHQEACEFLKSHSDTCYRLYNEDGCINIGAIWWKEFAQKNSKNISKNNNERGHLVLDKECYCGANPKHICTYSNLYKLHQIDKIDELIIDKTSVEEENIKMLRVFLMNAYIYEFKGGRVPRSLEKLKDHNGNKTNEWIFEFDAQGSIGAGKYLVAKKFFGNVNDDGNGDCNTPFSLCNAVILGIFNKVYMMGYSIVGKERRFRMVYFTLSDKQEEILSILDDHGKRNDDTYKWHKRIAFAVCVILAILLIWKLIVKFRKSKSSK